MLLLGCSDTFSPPRSPDLFKEPYDFSVVVPPFNGPGSDMTKAPTDMAATFTPD